MPELWLLRNLSPLLFYLMQIWTLPHYFLQRLPLSPCWGSAASSILQALVLPPAHPAADQAVRDVGSLKAGPGWCAHSWPVLFTIKKHETFISTWFQISLRTVVIPWFLFIVCNIPPHYFGYCICCGADWLSALSPRNSFIFIYTNYSMLAR